MRANDPHQSSRARLGVPVALAVLAVAFWHRRIIAHADKIMFGASDDPYTQIYPMVSRAAQWVREGTLPLWNPYQYAGHPFLATVLYGVFYPGNLLFLVLPPEYAMEASSVLHLFLAGLFTYAFLRELDLDVPAAFAGALTFPLSGFFASQALWFLPAWSAGVWLPLGLLAIERLLAARGLGWACVLALCVALPVLAGWLQTWIYTMYCLGAYLAVRTLALFVRPEQRGAALRAGMLGGAAIVVGIGLAAVQLFPSVELQSLGPRRPGGLTVIQSLGMGVIPPERFLHGAVDARPGFPRPTYVGALWLLVSAFTLLTARRIQVWFFLVLGTFAVLVAMTVNTPVFTLYRLLPASTWFRFPDRILFLYAFSASVLLASGLDAFIRAGVRSRRRLLAALLASATAAFWVGVVGVPRLAIGYLGAGVLLLWSAWFFTGPRMRAASLAGLIVLQTADLFFATRSPALHPFHDTTVYDSESAVLDGIKASQGLARTYIHFPSTRDPGLMPKQGSLRGIYSITDYEPLSLQRGARFYRTMEGKTEDPDAPPFIGLVNVPPNPRGLRMLDLLSVKYIVVAKAALPYRTTLEQNGWQPDLVPSSGNTVLYSNPKALPRAFVVRHAAIADSDEAALQMITAPSFDPRASVVLENHAPVRDTGAVGASAAPGAEIESYEPSRIVVRVDAEGAGWLVLTDTYYPGWRAEVDGKPVDIERANYLFRAVRVPGKSRVVFSYRPTSLRLGAAVSLLAVIMIGAALCVDRRRGSARAASAGDSADAE